MDDLFHRDETDEKFRKIGRIAAGNARLIASDRLPNSGIEAAEATAVGVVAAVEAMQKLDRA